MARRTWTDKSIAALKPRSKRYAAADPKLAGHYVRVTPGGAKSFVAVSRDPQGKQVWDTIGSTELYKLDEARELARTAIKAIRAGESRAGPQSFASVSEQWMKRHVEAKGLRSGRHIEGYLNLHILPAWGGREFESIRRGDVAALLDEIEDRGGPTAADYALGIVRAICNWYTTRNENYSSPIVRGMRRSNPKERARKRILSDDEIRAVWKQAEANGTFGGFVRLLLLTGQRRDKVVKLRWDDLTADGAWIMKSGPREKGNAGELVLPQVALDIISAQPRLAGNPYVFPGQRSGSPMIGISRRKDFFCAKLPPMPNWTLHDLRRTARSLMSRAGVLPDIAERVLGHAMDGVEGIYNRHQYTEEKAHALKSLAGLIDTIVNPPTDNIVTLAVTGTNA
jgi:integrase